MKEKSNKELKNLFENVLIINKKPAHTLLQCLKDTHNKILEMTHQDILAGKKKSEYANTIKSAMLDDIVSYFNRIDIDHLDLFKQIVEEEDLDEQNYKGLVQLTLLGLLYVYHYEDKYYYIVPKEVKKMYLIDRNAEISDEENLIQLTLAHIIANVNTYGYVELLYIIEIIKEQLNEQITVTYIKKVLKDTKELYIKKDYIIHENLNKLNNKEFDEFLEICDSKPFYEFDDAKEFMKSLDIYYYRNEKAYKEFFEFCLNKIKDNKKTSDIINELILKIKTKVDSNFMNPLEYTEEYFKESEIQKFIDKYSEFYNNTPMWINNGYSPKELSEIMLPEEKKNVPIISKQNKIGRNELCPCGSGKKYKKCCLNKVEIRKRIKQENAHLSEKDRDLFYKLYFGLLTYVNNKYKINKEIQSLIGAIGINPNEIQEIREKLWNNKKVITEYIEKNPHKLNQAEMEILKGFKKAIYGDFVMAKHEKDYTILYGEEKHYGIIGITGNIDEIMPNTKLPIFIKTAILPFKGKIIYDSMFSEYSIATSERMKVLIESGEIKDLITKL
ncbi:MAG: SEC-C metal-binding domain-containing protein [Bacilli bacterium]|nr:SEC-C metal-binding domain-containing protein [Bacilli bacterium]MDD4644033.1 SEC-C metal-binding domain-containing protein [Bacilli bacterium]